MANIFPKFITKAFGLGLSKASTEDINESHMQDDGESDILNLLSPRPKSNTPATQKKRAAPTNLIEQSTSQKRPRRNTKISQEESRLLPGHQYPNPSATPIAVPQNEWRSSDAMPNTNGKRKVGGSSFVIRNTLTGSDSYSKPGSKPHSTALSTLETAITAGDNVPNHQKHPLSSHDHQSIKRRKVDVASDNAITVDEDNDDEDVVAASDVPSDHLFFDRDLVSSVSRSRKLSDPITIGSQESVRKTQQDNYFAPREAKRVQKLVGWEKTNPRKAKRGSALDSQADQKDVIEIADSQPSQPSQRTRQMLSSLVTYSSNTRSAMSRNNDRVNRTAQSPINIDAVRQSPIREGTMRPPPRKQPSSPAIQVASAFDVLEADKSSTRSSRLEERRPSVSSSLRNPPNNDRISSPQLSRIFIRDDASPAVVPGSIRKRMLPSSGTNKKAHVSESEDEIAGGNDFEHRRARPVRTRTRRPTPPRQASPRHSPADIRSVFFTTSGPEKTTQQKPNPDPGSNHCADSQEVFGLVKFYTQSLMQPAPSSDLRLIYFHKARAFLITTEGCSLLKDAKDRPYPISNKHAQGMHISDDQSLKLRIIGSRDDVTGGDIWFEFDDLEDRDRCSQLVEHMTGGRVKIKKTDDPGLEKMFKHSIGVFEAAREKSHASDLYSVTSPSDNVTNRAVEARERTRAMQRGGVPSSQTLPKQQAIPAVPMRKRMESGFTQDRPRSDDRSSPLMEQSATADDNTVRSSRRLKSKTISLVQQDPEFHRWTHHNPLPKWESPLIYPATGPRRTTVEVQDIDRLDDGEFLNDSIISFCLRNLEEKYPESKDKVHIFNTFFYTALSTKSNKRSFNYDAVKRWTKNIDIFSYPFVLVPVNVSLHWFVMIICNLDKLGRKLVDDGVEEVTSGGDDDMIDNKIEDENEPKTMLSEQLSDSLEEERDELIRNEVGRLSMSDNEEPTKHDSKPTEESENGLGPSSPPTSERQTPIPAKFYSRKAKKRVPPVMRLRPDEPVIITLDSLGSTHSAETRNLKDYIIQEGLEKRGMVIERSDIKGIMAKGIPEQTNFCDCGVYLVGYTAEFLKDPTEFHRKVISREMDKNNDFADFDFSKKRAEIRDHLIKLELEQRETKRVAKKAAREAKLLKQAAEQAQLDRQPQRAQLDGASDDVEDGNKDVKSDDKATGVEGPPETEGATVPMPSESEIKEGGDGNEMVSASDENVEQGELMNFLAGAEEAAQL